jgi:hypothetical protein
VDLWQPLRTAAAGKRDRAPEFLVGPRSILFLFGFCILQKLHPQTQLYIHVTMAKKDNNRVKKVKPEKVKPAKAAIGGSLFSESKAVDAGLASLFASSVSLNYILQYACSS